MPPEPSKPIRHRKHPQERAQVRRSLLISAARRLLATHALDELSLPIIAREAGIAPSSTYHFFRDLYELYGELAVVIVSEMIGLIPSDLKPGDWEDVVEAYLHYAADTFNKDPAALQLILGTRTTPQIKRAACQDNAPFGEELSLEIDRHFVLPEIEDAPGVFFRAIQIADLMFCLSVSAHGRITPHMLEEGRRATCAYLAIYLPRHLPRRPAQDKGQGTRPSWLPRLSDVNHEQAQSPQRSEKA